MKLKLATLGAATVMLAGLGVAAPAVGATTEQKVAAKQPCPEIRSHPQISRGSSGTPVKHAQCVLNRGAGMGNVAIDGDFGPITEQAVKKVQIKCAIAVDGIVGPNTWRCLHKFNR